MRRAERTQIRQAKQAVEREHVVRRLSEGAAPAQIAAELGISKAVVTHRAKQAQQRGIDRYALTSGDVLVTHLPPPLPIGTILRKQANPEQEAHRERLRAACLEARTQGRRFEEIAQELDISPATARSLTYEALRSLAASEITHVELERRLMVEQLDALIRASFRQASNEDDPDLDAMDRVLKILDRKSKLLGLDQAQSVDIMIRLQEIAREHNYDMRELEDIARDVLARHRFQLPSGTPSP